MSVVHDPAEVGHVPCDAELHAYTYTPLVYPCIVRCYDCGAEGVIGGGWACIRDTASWPATFHGLGDPPILKSWNLCVPCAKRRRALLALSGP